MAYHSPLNNEYRLHLDKGKMRGGLSKIWELDAFNQIF